MSSRLWLIMTHYLRWYCTFYGLPLLVLRRNYRIAIHAFWSMTPNSCVASKKIPRRRHMYRFVFGPWRHQVLMLLSLRNLALSWPPSSLICHLYLHFLVLKSSKQELKLSIAWSGITWSIGFKSTHMSIIHHLKLNHDIFQHNSFLKEEIMAEHNY